MDTVDLIDVEDKLTLHGPKPRCECTHGGGKLRCERDAEARVTVLCSDPDCTDAVSVHLLCTPCLETWRLWPVHLRVRPL